MHMNFNTYFPGLTDVSVDKVEEMGERVVLHVSLPKRLHRCPQCHQETIKVHDYRMQKIKHLKWFERLTILFYKRRRYACACGKRFSEECPFVARYQRYSIEWNKVARVRSIKAKTFKEAGEVLGTSNSTIIRRFTEIAKKELVDGVHLLRLSRLMNIKVIQTPESFN